MCALRKRRPSPLAVCPILLRINPISYASLTKFTHNIDKQVEKGKNRKKGVSVLIPTKERIAQQLCLDPDRITISYVQEGGYVSFSTAKGVESIPLTDVIQAIEKTDERVLKLRQQRANGKL